MSHSVYVPDAPFLPMAGGQDFFRPRVDQVTPAPAPPPADVGEDIAIILIGDGVRGVLIGTLAAFTDTEIRIALTQAIDGIPAGTILSVRRDQIAAIGRLRR